MLPRYGVSGLIFMGCLLLLPHTVASLDPPTALCHNPEGCFAELLVELNKPASASKALSKANKLFHQMTTAYGQTPWAKQARLRYGYALRTVNPVEAIPLLRNSLTDFPGLEDYLHFWLFQAYISAGLWQEASRIVQEFTHRFQESLVRAEVLYEGGKVLLRIRDCPAARSVLSQALSVGPQHSQAASALFQIGTCAGQLGEKNKAIEVFRKVWWQFPLAPESLRAEQWLAQESGSAFVPTPGEQYQRALALYKGGALKKAVKEFQQVAEISPKTPQFFHAQFKFAMALVRLKRYDQAEKTLQMVSRSSSSRQADAWVWLGRTYLRQGKGKSLANLVKTLPADRLTGDQQAQLYTFYGIWLNDHDQWAEAVQVYQKARQVAQTLSRQIAALWQVGWIQYQHEQFVEAKNIFRDIIQKTNQPSSASLMHSASRALYWLARSEEHVGQMELASQHFQQISRAYPLTYYGQLAQSKLGSDGRNPQSWAVFSSTDSRGMGVPSKLQQDIHYQKLQALQAAQFSIEAVKELEQVYARHGSDAEVFPQLVALAEDNGAYDIGIRLSIRHFGQTLRIGQLPPASPAWSGAFPMGYQTIIQSFVPQHVDPFLVAGLIREESLYSARVVSRVGAIGLMQLMPATAKRVAQQMNLSDSKYEPDWLYQPKHNIQLGTHYLGQLLDEYQGNLIYSVAAYNAGPQAVQRWMAKNGHRPPDEFVELIGYRETRGYVKRVVGSYRIYRTLFGKACPGVSLDRFC
jgi:soluble lytic murein transglycosylase